MLSLHQVVRATKDLPEEKVRKGMVGAVFEVFEAPRRAFEVEFTDSEGRTVLLATLTEEDLEVVPD
jgi:hypothetical protein